MLVFCCYQRAWERQVSAALQILGAAFPQSIPMPEMLLRGHSVVLQIVMPLAMGTAGLAAGQWGAGAMVSVGRSGHCIASQVFARPLATTYDHSGFGMVQGLMLASLAAFVFFLW